MARKSLIEPGSILPGPDTLSRVIARDRDQSGRQAPSAEHSQDNETKQEQEKNLNITESNITSNTLSNMNDNTNSHYSDHVTDKSYDAMFAQPVSQSYEQPLSQSLVQLSEQAASNPTANVPLDQAQNQPSLMSAAQSIRQSVANPTVKVRYNAVTFKIHPGMEEWVNEHVRATGRMKQDVLNDALTLYRNLVEEVVLGDGGQGR